ncbi:MAG TPA: hypothetical protein VL400_24485 [Polyangiaceae bacterium]|nr:hypothetical protein [Polyangiaceae bacterium]
MKRRIDADELARDAKLLSELEAIYREVEERHRDHGCPASTECCRFGVTGREPYVTSVEVALVARAIAKRGGRLPSKRPASLAIVKDERVCPLLGADGRCTVYAARPLGCRTFYCERATQPSPVSQTELNEWVRAIKDVAARHAPRGDAGRPLTRALADEKLGLR